jgi:hypothetical protein
VPARVRRNFACSAGSKSVERANRFHSEARTRVPSLRSSRFTEEPVVSVHRIVDGVWAESPPQTARHMVEVYVSKLPKLLGADVLATRTPGYLLEVDPACVDIARFERLLSEGRDALGEGDAAGAASKLTSGLSLWRGPPLRSRPSSRAVPGSGRAC